MLLDNPKTILNQLFTYYTRFVLKIQVRDNSTIKRHGCKYVSFSGWTYPIRISLNPL